MKRILALAVAALFLASVIPAFADQPQKEQNLWKIMQHSKMMPVKDKDKLKNPAPQLTWFKTSANEVQKMSGKKTEK